MRFAAVGLLGIALAFTAAGLGPAAEDQGQQPRAPRFEVASIKPDTFVPSQGQARVTRLTCANGRFLSRNNSVWYVIKWAWNIVGDNDRLVGYPDWTSAENYEIDAQAAAPVTEDQSRLMMQSLLAERFQLRVHEEKRMMDVFDLVVAKDGPKIKRVIEPDAPVNGPGFTISGERIQMLNPSAKGWTMEQLAYLLRVAQLDRKVVDRTGLEGIYRIDLRFHRWDDAYGEGPDVHTALREQLGLELKRAREPIDVIVVDHIERPSPN